MEDDVMEDDVVVNHPIVRYEDTPQSAGDHIVAIINSTGNGLSTTVGLDTQFLAEVRSGERQLTPEQEESIVYFIASLGDMGSWARGDFALLIMDRIRAQRAAGRLSYEEYNALAGKEILRLADLFGVAKRTLYANMSTASVWPEKMRLNGRFARYKHHECIPRQMSIEERHDWIIMAEEEEWSWYKLYQITRSRTAFDGTPMYTPQDRFITDQQLDNIDRVLEGGILDDEEELKELDDEYAQRERERNLQIYMENHAAELAAREEQMLRDTDGDMPFTNRSDSPFDEVMENPFSNLVAGEGVQLTPFDLDNLPEDFQEFHPVEIGVPATQWTMNAGAAEGDWVSMSMIDENGVTTILTEGNESNQRIHVLFANGTTWEIIAHVALAKIQVRMLGADIDPTHKAYRD